MRTLTTTPIIAALLAATPVAFAQSGHGLDVDVDLGTWKLRPYLEVVVGYDTDVYAADDVGEEQDGFASLRLGVQQQKQIGVMRLSGDAYFKAERWRDNSQADDEDVGLNISIGAAESREFGSRETVAFYFDIGYNDGESLNYETGEVESSQSFNFGAGAGKTMGRLDVDLMYDYSTSSFGDSSRTFAKQVEFDDSRVLFDSNNHVGTAQAAYTREGGRSSIVGVAQYGLQSSDGFADDSNWYALRGGLAYRVSDKTRGQATVGILDNNDADEQIVSYDVGASYQATDKITLGVNGDSTIQPSVTDAETFNTIYTFGGNLRYLVTEKIAANLSVNWRDYESNQPVVRRTGSITQVVLPPANLNHDTVSTQLKLAWAPPREGYSVFGEILHEKRTSSLPNNDYDRYLFQTGLIVYY